MRKLFTELNRQSAGLLAASLIAFATLVLPSTAGAQDILLLNARIVDPAQEAIHEGNLLIEAGRITGRPATPPAGFAGEVVDLEGRWVIPGLNDLHTHAYGNMAPGNVFDAVGTATTARRYLYCGVTGFLDLFGNEDRLFELRREQRAGNVPGADLFASLSCLTATAGHCTEYGTPTRTMDSPEEARAVVADLARRQPDVVKIVYAPDGRMPSIDQDTLNAAVAIANEHGIKTVVHVSAWQGAADAVAAGASAITHVPDDGSVPDTLIAAMVARGVAHIPTLSVETDFPYFVTQPAVLDDSMARSVTTAELIAAYRTDEIRSHVEQRSGHRAGREAMILASVGKLSAAGVQMLTGTDAGNWGTLQGYSMHRELEKLVAAGLSTWQALAAATTAAGEFLGRDWGVAAGDEANLVVLDASPVEDIRNTRSIHRVMHHGEWVDRSSLLMAAEE